MNTLKVETTQTEKHIVEIPVPSFWKDPNCSSSISDIRGLLDAKTFVQVWESERRTFVCNSDTSLMENEIIEAFKKWEQISEEDFMTAYNRALHSMSLTPELAKEETI